MVIYCNYLCIYLSSRLRVYVVCVVVCFNVCFIAIAILLADTSTTGQETRSELQECALSSGLLMFGILLERFIRLIQDALDASEGSAKDPDNGDYGASETPKLILPEDAKVILPAIKVGSGRGSGTKCIGIRI